MNTEQNQARKINDNFLEKMSKIDLRYAAGIPVLLGASIMMTGVGIELHQQGEMIKQGYYALQNYMASGQSAGLPAIEAGLAVSYVGAPLTLATAALAKGFANVTKFAKAKVREVNDNVMVSQGKGYGAPAPSM